MFLPLPALTIPPPEPTVTFCTPLPKDTVAALPPSVLMFTLFETLLASISVTSVENLPSATSSAAAVPC